MNLRYFTGAFAYGACRTAYYTWGRSTCEYDENFNKKERSLLHTEILGLSIVNGVFALGLFPIFLWEDACNVERHMRDIPLQPRSATVMFWWSHR